jgi:hypothetical protein
MVSGTSSVRDQTKSLLSFLHPIHGLLCHSRWRSGCGDKKVGESVQQQLLREGLKSVEMLSVLSAEDLVP